MGAWLQKNNFTKAAEIGVQCGIFSKKILKNWPIGHLTMIDSWENFSNSDYLDIANVSNDQHNHNLNTAISNVRKFVNRFEIIKSKSNEAYKLFEDNHFDLVYLDANHRYDSIFEDIKLWVSKVKAGGYISGHDYVDGIFPEGDFGVKKAVRDFFGKDADFVTTDGWPSWFIKI